MYRINELCHLILSNYIKPGDIVADATCGNGYDTYFLASLVGDNGLVYSYDIQAIALNNAMSLNKEYNNIKYIHDSHENIINNEDYHKLKAVVFNLGYLPNGDKSITTNALSTLKAIKNIIPIVLNNQAIILITCYLGHTEGKLESDVLTNFTKELDSRLFLVCEYKNTNQNNAPYLICISKK